MYKPANADFSFCTIRSEFIVRAPETLAPFGQDVGIDHGRIDVFMTKKLLDRAFRVFPQSPSTLRNARLPELSHSSGLELWGRASIPS